MKSHDTKSSKTNWRECFKDDKKSFWGQHTWTAEQWQLSVNSDNPGSQLTIAELLCMFIFFLWFFWAYLSILYECSTFVQVMRVISYVNLILSCLPMSRKRISDRHAKEMTLIAVSGLCAAVCIPVPPKPSKYHIEYIWVSIKELLWFRLSAVIPLYCSLSHCEQFPTK